MTLPFDLKPTETRKFPVTFYTDESNNEWLQTLVRQHEMDRSWIVHQMITEARKAATRESDRRAGEDRRRAS